MKIEQTTKNAAVMNTASDTMGVDASKQEKLLFMLSDKLYANKFNSIIRELASNARDSHDEAGNPEPFVITAPTPAEPSLSIEDFGMGLDYETAKRTILMFLGSTKDYDDDKTGRLASQSIGGFGIGSKSPRAYTPDYQMILRKDGVEYVVVISNNEQGLPQSNLLAETPTDKPNGVKVVVPVKTADIYRWQNEVEAYVEGTNYNCVAYIGGNKHVPPTPVASIDFGDFHLDVLNKAVRSNSEVRVSYGGVLYQMTHEQSIYDRGLAYKLQHNLKSEFQFRIRVETSDKLDFSLSREAIENTEKTVEFLTKVLKTLNEEVNKTLAFGNQKFSGTVVEHVTSYDEAVEKLELQVEAYHNRVKTKLGDYVRYNFTEYRLEVGGFYLEGRSRKFKRDGALYLSNDHTPDVEVLWSNEPISNDMLKTLAKKREANNEVTIKCPEKTLEKVKAWMEKKFPNLPYHTTFHNQPKRVSTTRSEPKFTVCAATDKRIELKYAKYAVQSADLMWVGKAMGVEVFVPSAAALKRGLPAHIKLLTEDEIFTTHAESLQWVESVAVGNETAEALYQMVEYLERNRNKFLDKAALKRGLEILSAARMRSVTLVNRMRRIRSLNCRFAIQTLPAHAYREMEFNFQGTVLKASDAIRIGNDLVKKSVVDGDKVSMLNTEEFVKRLAEGDKLAEKLAKLLKLA